MRNLFVVVVVILVAFLSTSCGFELASDEMIIGGHDNDVIDVPDETSDEAVKDDNEKPDVETPDNEKPDVEKPDTEVPDVEKPDTETPDNDNDDPTVSISGPIGIEEGDLGTITFTLDKASEYRTTIYFQFNPENTDTGIYGRDYSMSLQSTQVVFLAGEKQLNFHIRNIENSLTEGNKKITIRMFSGSNYVNLGNSQIVVLLYDNDIVDSGTFYFSETSFEVMEGDKKCISVMRTGGSASTLPASVVVKKVSGDLSDVVIDPLGNYVDGVIINFAAGETSKQFCITGASDNVAEVNETVEFKLESPSSQSRINAEKAALKVVIKDKNVTEIVIDAGNSSCKEFVSVIGKAVKCFAYGARTETFNADISKKYRLKGVCALDCPDLGTSDYFTCNGAGVDQKGSCSLPLGGNGCTHNGDCL